MTELSPATHSGNSNYNRAGSVGLTLPGTRCRIVGDDGNDLGTNAEGEMWISGPQVMQGYLANPKSTAETIDVDGWLRTGTGRNLMTTAICSSKTA